MLLVTAISILTAVNTGPNTLTVLLVYVTLSHLSSKAQAVIHNWYTTLMVDQNSYTIPTGIHHQQQQNKPTTTLECN